MTHAGLALALMTAALCGCPNPNTYGTPRTTPPGEIQHTIAAEGIHLGATTKTTNNAGQPATETDSLNYPMFPTYQLRVGVADTVDLGFRIANLDSIGADVKWNFLRSPSFDLAVNPGIQGMYFSVSGVSTFTAYFHLPLIAGFNFDDKTTLVLAGGLVGAYVSATVKTGDDDGASNVTGSGGGLGARGGLGFEYRFTPKFALHPEVSVMRFFTGAAGDVDELEVVFGLGFNFGHLPHYGSDPGAH